MFYDKYKEAVQADSENMHRYAFLAFVFDDVKYHNIFFDMRMAMDARIYIREHPNGIRPDKRVLDALWHYNHSSSTVRMRVIHEALEFMFRVYHLLRYFDGHNYAQNEINTFITAMIKYASYLTLPALRTLIAEDQKYQFIDITKWDYD